MKIIGHRGARGLAPENTVASVAKALEHHVDEVEFDVRVSKDGVVVLHHDPELRDHSGTTLGIVDHTYAELLAHKPDLATLDEVFRTVDHRVPMLIDVKSGIDTAALVRDINAALKDGWKPEELLLSSRTIRELRALHAALPQIQIVVIECWSGVRGVRRAREFGTKRLSMNHHWLWRGFLAPMHRRGWEICPYTLNDPAKARKWSRYGITGVITDYPDRFET